MPTPDPKPVHLFTAGSIITACCRLAAIDARITPDLGTYDPDAATCTGTEAVLNRTAVPSRIAVVD